MVSETGSSEMRNLVIAASAALVMGLAGGGEAKADHCMYGRGFGSSYHGGYPTSGFSLSIGSYGGYGGYGGLSTFGGYPSYGGGHVHRTWHDTSHYDYHPPTAYRHRNHYHVVPGHYDLHRTGHWDTHYHR